MGAKPAKHADVVLGEDWIGSDAAAESEARAKRDRRGVIAMNRSPLARKIITFNLLAILVLVAGVLFLNPFRDSLVIQRERGIVIEAELISGFFEAQLPQNVPVNLSTGDGLDIPGTLAALEIPNAVEIFVYDTSGGLLATTVGQERRISQLPSIEGEDRSTVITDFLNSIWGGLSGIFGKENIGPDVEAANEDLVAILVAAALEGGTEVQSSTDAFGNTIFTVATPILQGETPVGAVAIGSAAGEIDQLVRSEREQVLQMFVIAILVSIGLSLVLASTIANPLSDLAAAAEIGREKNARRFSPNRVRIP
ncbi:MAG: sensor N-terminal transmembrane domain-containing protein, partial [Boseongicola sp.]|nr:sensor N-terminal transmembrane domain-containing protein [Boseongicola sp.]